MKALIHQLQNYKATILATVATILWPFLDNIYLKNSASYQTGKWSAWDSLIIHPLQIPLICFLLFLVIKQKHLVTKLIAIASIILIIVAPNPLTISLSLLISYLTITNLKKSTKHISQALIIFALLQTLIAGGQFLFQSDLGLQIINEPELNESIKGVAKLDLPLIDKTIIRSYGTFTHPNILSAFLSLTILVLVFTKTFPRKYYLPLIIILNLGLFTTLSRNTIYLIPILLIFSNKEFKKYWKELLIIGITIVVIFTTRTLSPHTQLSNQERITQIAEFQQTELTKKAPWEHQPIHNIYLLFLEKYKIFSILILGILFLNHKKTNLKQTSPYLCLLLLIGLTDHFLLTLPIGNYLILVSQLNSTKPYPNIPEHSDAY